MYVGVSYLREVRYRLVEGADLIEGQASIVVGVCVVWIDSQHCRVVCDGQLVLMVLYVCMYVCTVCIYVN